jgi:hypothetical protein
MPGPDPSTWNFRTGQVGSAYAQGSVQIEKTKFDQLFQRLAETGVAMQQELIVWTMELHRRIALRTPVRTGRARNSWHVVKPNQTDSYPYADNQGTQFDGTLQNTTTGPWDTVVGSNVNYMLFLEAGHSRQAPNGMVAVSLAELQQGLVQRIRAVIEGATHRG